MALEENETKIILNARVKKILEQVSRTRFLTGFEIRALSFGATQQGRRGREIQIP